MSLNKFKILVVDDEEDITLLVQDILEDEGYLVETAKNAKEADEIYKKDKLDLVLLDIWMPDEDGISLLTRWFDSGLKSNVIIMSGHGTIETAVKATKLGAFDFIEKPISIAKLLITVEKALKNASLEKKNEELVKQLTPNVNIIGKSKEITSIKDKIEKVKNNDLPILFLGSSGVGKSHYARYAHQISKRKSNPFIIINASLLSRDNQKDDIFGNEEKKGIIDIAENGSIFIDEIVDLDKETQLNFLKLMEQDININLYFASKYSSLELIENTNLIKDFYYKIELIKIIIPDLKEYNDDIPELIKNFVFEFVDNEDLKYRDFSMQSLNFLRQYDWPGNVRELKNFIQRLLVIGDDGDVNIDETKSFIDTKSNVDNNLIAIDLSAREAREDFEKKYFLKQLEFCNGNIAKLSSRTGMERTNLYRKLKSLGIKYK